ncbi:hypothetical protein SECTIM467_118 [Brevibacillus phage SecTim467]|uniref:Uncharacterized protein n=2 Tax=Jenstvirus jenst TaxID=1982225 RepID=A0A0K2CP69_9CAUD|nr:hypothetical protein AVV11_gp078 [Brevibacillus phage Jenst]ALA07242.1 hypothetical protein JENST_113 [Brevibacillus phage Jenst]ALA07566.1 hypothetical protein SECTIM467_118 [Brevibacillus phage SecTim467]
MKKIMDAILVGLGVTAISAGIGAAGLSLVALLLILKPLLAILIGWVIGHGVAFVAGSFVAGALSTIFHTTITVSMLPSVFAGLSLISSFIRPVTENNDVTELQKGTDKVKNQWSKLRNNLRNSK